MHKQDPKIQTCVLRVNIHCEGCMHKVKKTLKKIEGVYKVNIDVEQSKVTVSGNVDPAILINKLEKSGKHAELWGPPQKGPISIMNMSNQFKNNFQIENKNGGGKDNKPHKGFKEQNKGGVQIPQQQMHLKKGSNKDVKTVGKNQNSVRFNLPEDEEDDDDSEYFEDDDDDDEFDDGSDDGGYASHKPPAGKGAHLAGHNKSNKETPKKDHVMGKNGGDTKKSGGINMFLKGMLGKAGGNNGKVGHSHDKASGNENEKESGKKNGKKGGFEIGKGKNGDKGKDSWSKKVGEKFDGGHKMEGNKKQQVFHEMNLNHRGGGGGGGMGGQMGDFTKTMNGGNFQGNPYNQQQMANMMMMMNQHNNANRGEGYHPLGYAAARPPPGMGYGQQPMPPPGMGYGPQSMPLHAMGYGQQQQQPMPPAMGYGPPPPMGNDQFTHIFSDENTDSCTVM